MSILTKKRNLIAIIVPAVILLSVAIFFVLTESNSTYLKDFEYHATPNGVVIDKYIGDSIKVKIPNKIEGEPVIEIAERAFANSGIRSVDIPNNVINIGDGAFRNCSGITEIKIPNNVERINDETFKGCTGLKDVVIPDSVTEIGKSAFEDCVELVKITIPNYVRIIQDDSFKGCTGLIRIKIPNASVGEGAFADCTNLVEVIIENQLLCTIGMGAFQNCNNITNLLIGDGVSVIGYYAFEGCDSLTKVVIPDSVKVIGNCFNYCYALVITYRGNDYLYSEFQVLYDNINGS